MMGGGILHESRFAHALVGTGGGGVRGEVVVLRGRAGRGVRGCGGGQQRCSSGRQDGRRSGLLVGEEVALVSWGGLNHCLKLKSLFIFKMMKYN